MTSYFDTGKGHYQHTLRVFFLGYIPVLLYFSALTFYQKFDPFSLALAYMFLIWNEGCRQAIRAEALVGPLPPALQYGGSWILLLMAIWLPKTELAMVFLWVFTLVSMVAYDPRLDIEKKRGAFSALFLGTYGVFVGYRLYSEPDISNLKRDVYILGFLVLVLLTGLGFYQRRRGAVTSVQPEPSMGLGEMTMGFYMASSQGMGVLDIDFKFIDINSSLEKKFKVEAGSDLYAYLIADDILYFEEALARATQSGFGQCFVRWLVDDGKVVNVDLSLYWNKASLKYFIQIHDVTQLRTLYVKQKAIMDALERTTLVEVTDLEGRITEVNLKFYEVSGYEPAEVVGRTHAFLKSGLHKPEFYKHMWQTLRKGDVWKGEIANKNKQGEVYWIYSSIAPLFDERAHPIGFIGLGQEITPLKREQAQAIHAGKMATLGEMASGVAHEINNPLAVIAGRAALMKKRLQETTEAENHQVDIEKIESQVLRISKIISGLRLFSRTSDNDSKEPTSMRKIIEDSIELVEERYLKNKVKIKVLPFEDVIIVCRHIEIIQVLMSILNNAFDAVLPLETKWIQLSITKEGRQVLIRVTDSGQGIDPQVVDKMMTPFFTTKEVGKGTGLGLSIAKGIIEEHGGQLNYNDQSPNTEFIIALPLYNQ